MHRRDLLLLGGSNGLEKLLASEEFPWGVLACAWRLLADCVKADRCLSETDGASSRAQENGGSEVLKDARSGR